MFIYFVYGKYPCYLISLNNSLVASDGQKLYFDSKDGKYGYNTDPNRGADTFVPFSSVDKIELFNGNFINTDIATIKHNATLSNNKIVSTALNSGIWINTFNLANPENYVIVCEFSAKPSSAQIGYCTTSASMPTIVNSGSSRLSYMSGSSYGTNFSCQVINDIGFFAGFIGTLEKVYLLKIK